MQSAQSIVLLILFAVSMFLWLLAEISTAPPAGNRWNRLGLVAWFAVLFLFLLVHGFRA